MTNSNAPAGYPSKNEEGYELFYALGLDKQPAPGTQPSIIFDGQTFGNMEEVRSYKERTQKNKENSAKEDRGVDTVGVGFPRLANPNEILRGFNAASTDVLKWYMLTQEEHYALQNLGWKRADINRHVAMYNSPGYYPEGWIGSIAQQIREPWRR